MRGMPFQLQGKGVFEIASFAPICAWNTYNHKKEGLAGFVSDNSSGGNHNNDYKEPSSVLHMRRSPSPPTSASTLSSSFGGGGGGGGSSDPPPTATVPEQGATRKDEWASVLQPIPSGLEAVTGVGGRCALGLEDWESMLSETEPSPNHEHDPSLLRWIANDVEDPSFGFKHLLQTANNPLDLEGIAALGVVDQGLGGLEPMGGVSTFGNLISSINQNPNLSAYPASGGFNSNNNGNGKIGGAISQSSSGILNHKVSGVGLNINNSSNCNMQNPVYSCPANSLPLPVTLPSGMIYQQHHHHFEAPDEKPQIVNPQGLLNQQAHSQNPNFLLPLSFSHQEHHLLQPPPSKRPNPVRLDSLSSMPKVPFGDPGHDLLQGKPQQQSQQQQQQSQHLGFYPELQFLPQHLQQQKPLMVPKLKTGPGEEDMARHHHQQQQQQQQFALLDQLYKAAELLGTGNFSHAQGILARLNHQLSPVGKPLHRAAFYFKEALQLLLLMNNPVTSPPPRTPTPFDIIFKMGAYKVFSEVSPLIQFVNFTCNQALLEALDDVDRIHIVDFDIGFGAQWASFMQELPVRNRGAPSLKITAFASPYTHHAIELALMRDNLKQFANEIGISFELEVVNFDCLDQNSFSLPILRPTENEAVAVNFPIWSSSNQPAALPSLLRFVKQLSPKIVVSLDRGCDRTDLPFPQHVVQALHSYITLLESLDAVNVNSDAVNKIEKFLLQPKIESTVLGRLRAPDKMPQWKTLFSSAGFSPVTFSNFTETQAECVVKRTPVRGFHVEKRQASLALCWQRRELISAAAWRC